jgi:hypothetical protein
MDAFPSCAMIKTLQVAFKDLLRTLHKLFLEMTGFFFLAVGGMILLSGYRQLRIFLDLGEVSYFKMISTLIFGILMVGYGIHSFFQVRKM